MQPTPGGVAAQVLAASGWNERVTLIRRIPEQFGVAALADVYAAIAELAYVPSLAADFGLVHWKPDYEYEPFQQTYAVALQATKSFTLVDTQSLENSIETDPRTLRVFRLILGLTTQEFAECSRILQESDHTSTLGNNRIKQLESGRPARAGEARACASIVNAMMSGRLFPSPGGEVRSKIEKPDTAARWETVRELAAAGVPYQMFLHQRHFGGPFGQLLNATSSRRGDTIEDAVADVLSSRGIPFIQTGATNQREIAARFGLSVRPAPDFVIADSAGNLRAILECKGANDGGTARDKAARFVTLRREGTRLGGVPVFAVLAGLGWRRTGDALGPVVEATDGRVFTPLTLPEITDVDPLSHIRQSQ